MAEMRGGLLYFCLETYSQVATHPSFYAYARASGFVILTLAMLLAAGRGEQALAGELQPICLRSCYEMSSTDIAYGASVLGGRCTATRSVLQSDVRYAPK
eukprot:2364279-Rhodomonas_salina.4